jgi:large subunit ribosomal protein L21
MYAVVKIAERQLKVTNGLRLKVPKLNVDEGATHTINDVLMVSDEEGIHVGTPLVSGASVTATVLGHGRDKKVIVFKMKRRKTFRKRNGHRQQYTELVIGDILLGKE